MMSKQLYLTLFSLLALAYASMTKAASLGKNEETNNLLFGRDETIARTPNCGKPSPFRCDLACPVDPRCELLGYNTTGVTCGCPCMECNGKYYGPTYDYKNSTALTPKERAKCLDVTHPCKTHD
ncbi:uncharacterized protein FA14DRAFT_67561 [Meira miltonrushii]|uniref:Uncharacterized protein n=1 Tax=Meira miltonrushii TaxID=1280837 RepID=A0A316VDC9_9BASI|nr:uncharacterized protein FA14DRAFT_67561 [Meira miltonrushii]PWN33991.1 hypothetical protein FA14DRAFT_67561 [Meira miltonrushii]